MCWCPNTEVEAHLFLLTVKPSKPRSSFNAIAAAIPAGLYDTKTIQLSRTSLACPGLTRLDCASSGHGAYPPPMMTMHVVSSVSGRSASQSSAADDCALDGVIIDGLGDVGKEIHSSRTKSPLRRQKRSWSAAGINAQHDKHSRSSWRLDFTQTRQVVDNFFPMRLPDNGSQGQKLTIGTTIRESKELSLGMKLIWMH